MLHHPIYPYYLYALAAKYFIPVLLLFASCAQPVVPTGGNKDEEPPRIKSVSISRGTSTTVDIHFNENVIADLPEQRIVISPALVRKAEVKYAQHSLIIRFDTVLPECFSIQFLSQAVLDINEKNVMPDTTIFIRGNNTLDSMPASYYLSGRLASSYELEDLKNTSVYLGSFDSIPHTLAGYPYTKTNQTGKYVHASFDTLPQDLLLLKDDNQNHNVDSGEFFFVIKNRKPGTTPDTSTIQYLPSDLPRFSPVAERVYFGYRIYGYQGHLPHSINSLPTVRTKESTFLGVTINDTTYILNDSLDNILYKPVSRSPVYLRTKSKVGSIQPRVHLQQDPYDSTLFHFFTNKPLKQVKALALTSISDTLTIQPYFDGIHPFIATFYRSAIKYTRILVPDSSIQFTDGTYLPSQSIALPQPRDSVNIAFRKPNKDTAYYLLQIRSKQNSAYVPLRDSLTTITLPVDEYRFLIIQDSDRNGFITPASKNPYRKQEYHYNMPTYILRKGLDAEEVIVPKR